MGGVLILGRLARPSGGGPRAVLDVLRRHFVHPWGGGLALEFLSAQLVSQTPLKTAPSARRCPPMVSGTSVPMERRAQRHAQSSPTPGASNLGPYIGESFMRRPHALLGSALLFCLLASAPAPPESSLLAGTAERLDFQTLSDSAELILEGVVLAAIPIRTPEGRIETEYHLNVDRTFWGEDLPTRALRLPGGVLSDGSGLLLPGVPRLATGERYVLFLSERGSSGVRMPVGLGQGRYQVVPGPGGVRMVARRMGDTALTGGGHVASGEGVAVQSYADFAAALEVALVQREEQQR